MTLQEKTTITAYHGSNSANIETLTPSARGSFGPGIYFADTLSSAKAYGPEILKARFILSNPWIVSADYESKLAIEEDFDSPSVDAILSLLGGRALLDDARQTDGLYDERLQALLIEAGYDGIIATYRKDNCKEYVVFSESSFTNELERLSKSSGWVKINKTKTNGHTI